MGYNKERQHAWYLKNRVRLRAVRHRYYLKHREAFSKNRRKWVAEHPERWQEIIRKWRVANKEHIRKTNQIWYINNKKHSLEYGRSWRKRNRARLNERQRQKYEANREYKRAYDRNWSHENRLKLCLKMHRRRMAKGFFDADHLDNLFIKQENRCAYYEVCGKKIYKSKRQSFHVDHIFPITGGGTNHARNIQLTCPACNEAKHNKPPGDFARERGLLARRDRHGLWKKPKRKTRHGD